MFKISEVHAIKKVANPLQLKEILNMSHTTTLFSQMLSLIPRHVSYVVPCQVSATH